MVRIKRAGLLYLAKSTGRFLLILENSKWTVPTFVKEDGFFLNAEIILEKYSQGKIIPIELYTSSDQCFEYSTYVCLVNEEFLTTEADTLAWVSMSNLPKSLHTGLKHTLANPVIQTQLDNIIKFNK